MKLLTKVLTPESDVKEVLESDLVCVANMFVDIGLHICGRTMYYGNGIGCLPRSRLNYRKKLQAWVHESVQVIVVQQ